MQPPPPPPLRRHLTGHRGSGPRSAVEVRSGEVRIGKVTIGEVTIGEVTIGIVAALPIEGAAMERLIEDAQRYSVEGDPNNYRIGLLPSGDSGRPHRVALTTLPLDNTRNAATACTNLIRSFPSVRCIVVTGIAGGVPSPNDPSRHVRLGDVVVAVDGLVDFGHVRKTGRAQHIRRPAEGISMRLISAARELQVQGFAGRRSWEQWLDAGEERSPTPFARPPEGSDVLYVRGRPVPHPDRALSGHPVDRPKIHYSSIGCADMLLKDERLRDQLAARHGFVAVEMESSGIAASAAQHGIHWFAVRGIADYCDAGKNSEWHGYASMASAAYVRAMLEVCRPFPELRLPGGEQVLGLLADPEREALVRLIRQVPDVDPRTLWYASAGDLTPAPTGELSTVEQVLDHLASVNAGSDGLPPALALVEILALRADLALCERLREWNDAQARRLQVTDALRRWRERNPAGAGGAAVPSVIVQIELDGLDRQRCQVSHWIQRRRGSWQPQRRGDIRNVALAKLEREVARIVEGAENTWHEGGEVAVEFVLPTVLMSLPVQWWRTHPESDQPSPLGLDYPVVVRSLERMRATNHRRMWVNRWNSLFRQPYQHHIHWGVAEDDETDLGAWDAQLRVDDTINSVVLSEPPDSRAGRAELEMALRAGIPVIMWDRRARPPASIRGVILALTKGDPHDLPHRMRRLRGEAASARLAERATHPGQYLALLWDDPNRPVNARGADR
jgi:nucleoside phosphorylase